MAIGPLELLRQATPGQRRTLLAAGMGWALDAFDAMLYSLVLAMLMRDLGMSKTVAGSLGTLTLLASGIGGVLFGFLADRIGRKQALMASILTYSVCSFASGLATSIAMLAVARFVLGLGMGGEWNTGATLVAETWPTELRAKAISIVQSSWALGFAAAALVAGPVARYYGWRAVFFVGILPAVITLWIQRSVPESEMWQRHNLAGSGGSTNDVGRDVTNYVPMKFSVIFRAPYGKQTFALLFFNFFAMFAWWGLFTWLPPYLSLPLEQGGRGFGVMGMTTLMVVLNLCGMFPGYASFGWVADNLGRRRAFLVYTLAAALLIPLYAMARSQAVLLVLGTWSLSLGQEFFQGRGLWAARSFPPRCGRGPLALPTTERER
jgi:MFS family permease